MLSSLFYLTLLNWPADHSPSLLVFFGLLFAFVSLVVLFWCFPCFLVWFLDCDGSLDYVSVLASSTVEAIIELPTSLLQLAILLLLFTLAYAPP